MSHLVLQPANPDFASIPIYEAGEKLSDEATLASNEAPFVSEAALAASQAAQNLNAYPDCEHTKLRAALAAHHGVETAQILCSVGSSLLLSHLTHAFCGAGGTMIQSKYGFPSYRMEATRYQAKTILIPEKEDMTSDVDAFIKAAQQHPKALLILDNPGNPRGTCLPRAEIERLVKNVPETCAVVVDSAYAQFVTDMDYTDGVDLIQDHPNVIVLHTFSKFYGLADARVGYMIAQPEVTQVVRHYQPPFLIGKGDEAAAIAALKDTDYKEKVLAYTLAWRKKFTDFASESPLFSTFESHTNFLLYDVTQSGKTAPDWYTKIKDKCGLLTRPVGDKYLRFSMGPEDQVQKLLDFFQDLDQNV